MKWISVVSLLLIRVAHAETTASRPQDIVDLHDVDPSIAVEMMYGTEENFVGQKIDGYKANICFLTKPAAEGLKKAQQRLEKAAEKRGETLKLLVRDCYRPQKAVLHFVRWVKDAKALEMKSHFYPGLEKSQLIADNYISPVSGHSRASSVDLTILRRNANGDFAPLNMGTPVDFFGEKSHTEFSNLTAEEKQNRKLLLEVLSPEFKNYSKEWWHFVLKTEPYPKTFFDFDITSSRENPPILKENDIVTELTSPELLAVLDKNHGSLLSFSSLLEKIPGATARSVPPLNADQRARAKQLTELKTTYGQVAATIAKDIDALTEGLGIDWEKDITKTYDPSAAKTQAGREHRKNGNVTRIFNERWLTSDMGEFFLSGVINRIDRRDFVPGTCGEVRFIYRLGYETQMQNETYASRLPFTVNMVFSYPDDGKGCQEVAQLWSFANLKEDSPALLVHRLERGPLDFQKLRFRQLEINAQVARFPSDLENAEKRNLAGQAIYLMRIFGLKDEKLVPRKLENTPDVTKLLKDPSLKKQLADFIQKNRSSIENGVFQIPDPFLSDVALTYSTLGSARLANKPFDVLFASADKNAAVSIPPVTLEKLNTASCMGCHQASSTAGFHLLGSDRADFGTNPEATKKALDGNRLVLPFSPHLFAELPRRKAYVASLANGVKPNAFRPHPSAPPGTWSANAVKFASAGENMPCPLPKSGTKAPWSCDASRGLHCEPLVENSAATTTLGQCVPSEGHVTAGLSCRKNNIDDSTTLATSSVPTSLGFNLKAFRDRNTRDELFYHLTEGKLDANQYNCRPTKIGVPLGRVSKNCDAKEATLADLKLSPLPKEMCAVVGGKGFEEMAKGYFNSQRFAAGVGRGLLNTCSPTRFCREDYICQEMPDFLTDARFKVAASKIAELRKEHVGFCTPTYFVYQLRLDGHPNPL